MIISKLLLKEIVLAYIFGSEHKNIDARNDDFFTLFDERFKGLKKFFSGAETAPNEGEIAQPFMERVVKSIAIMFAKNASLFNEQSYNIFDFPSLTGFSAVWSVLEFVFCLKEVHRREDTDQTKGSLSFYGEGVFVAAATLLCLTRQRSLYNVLSIGDRIVQQNVTDIAVLDDETLSKFLSIYQLVNASLSFSFYSMQPAVDSVIGVK